jgi:hypothetical protein
MQIKMQIATAKESQYMQLWVWQTGAMNSYGKNK